MQKLSDNGVDLSILNITVSKLRFCYKQRFKKLSLNERLTNNQISEVFSLDGLLFFKV